MAPKENPFAAAASKGRKNLGFGPAPEEKLTQYYPDLFSAVIDIAGEFCENEMHVAMFVAESERFLEQ